MSDIIDFRLVRFESLLIKFAKSNEIPIEFLDGTMNLDYLSKRYTSQLSDYHKKVAVKLKRLLSSKIKKSADNVLESFMEDYIHFYNNQCTKEEKWRIIEVARKYRPNLNPIRALYYELLNIMNEYNPENEVHQIVVDLFLD